MKVDPKVVLGFLKKRWPALVCGLLIVVSIPLGLFFSMSMRDSLRERVQKAVEEDVRGLADAKTVTYSVPATPGTAALELSGPPNQKLIDEFRARRARQAEDLKQVVTSASAFNATHAVLEGRDIKRVQRKPLVEGLFPKPTVNDRLTRSNFQRLYIERAHQDLLTRYRTGGPPDPGQFVKAIEEYKVQQIALVAGEGKSEGQLSEAELKRVQDAVIAYRIGLQKQRAAQLAFYTDAGAFSLPTPSDDPPEIATLWDWQQTYWIREDVLAAAAVANRGAIDEGVPGGVVKRIEFIDIPALFDPKAPGGFQLPGGEGAAPPPAPAEGGAVPVDYTRSVTGRIAGPTSGNTFFDIREATVTAIVSTQRIAEFIDALAQTNFISVLDLDVARLDTHLEQQAGFYYGAEPVSRVTVRLETIWLREWLAPTMPSMVKAHFGVPDAAPADPNAPTDPGAAPPPASTGGGGG